MNSLFEEWGRATKTRVGRTPSSAPDPLVRLCAHPCRPTGGSAAGQGARPTRFMLTAILFAAALATAQTTTGPILSYTATTDKVAGAPDSIRIDLLRWSTDAERDQLITAWTNPTAPGAGGRGGRGRAGAPPPDPTFGLDDPALAGLDGNSPAATGRGAGGRGGGRGAGGRGGGRAAAPAPEAPPPTPEGSLAAALAKAPTVGHIWSSEVAGYSVRSAIKLAAPDGSERILLVTDRRLGAYNDLWKPVGSDAVTNYEFSVIELHVNAKGDGEGRTSLTGKVAVDSAAKIIGLENYSALPVILKNVRRK
jgi:hypothetical protein